jgi:predicted nucleic acid-binding Zn ribbon protein
MHDDGRINWSDDIDEDEETWNNGDEGIVTWDVDRNEVRATQEIDAHENRAHFVHCVHCGNRIHRSAEICPHCGIRVSEPQHQKKGSTLSFVAGVIVGFIVLVLLSGIFILGPIIAGVFAGVIAGGGAGRGASAGFTTGTMGFFILAMILMVGGSIIGMSLDSIVGVFATLFGAFSAIFLMFIGFFYGILCMIGGAVGGLLRG